MHRSATMTLLGVLASPSFAWVSISQARYGAQISDIRQLYDNTSMPSSLPVQQLLGHLWSQPTSSTSKAGLGGGKANGRPTLGGAKAKSKANTKHVTIEGGDRAASPPQGRESSFDAV